MKRIITLAALFQLGTASASVVAIMDTGTDISHKSIIGKVWTNKNEVLGSKVDLDGSGLAGDVHGWDYTENSGVVFDGKYNRLMTEDVVKFYKFYAKFDTKTITANEFLWLQSATMNKALMDKVNFVGVYAHGTHVGGVAVLNNPKAELMSLKVLPTYYQEEAPQKTVEKTVEENKPQKAPSEAEIVPAMTIEDFKKAIVREGVLQIEEMIPVSEYVKFHKVDVVNQSFGIGFETAVEFISNAFIANVNRVPTKKELNKMTGAYFSALLSVGPKIFSAAPETLFVLAAGNDFSDNDARPDFPASIKAPNKIVVTATLGYSELAVFSNYGEKSVDVAAPGVAIESAAPNNKYVFMSGTSQAAPFVTNVISQAKDINPALTVTDLKSIILKTVDVKDWLKGKVATSGIVNKKRVLKAAELSKTMNVEIAIKKANIEIEDVSTPKSFAKRPSGMILNYKPVRPTLLVKLPIL